MGNLVISKGEYKVGTPDRENNPSGPVTVIESNNQPAESIKAKLDKIMDKIQAAHIHYDPMLYNSNAAVYQAIYELGEETGTFRDCGVQPCASGVPGCPPTAAWPIP